ncbi:LytR C-terminal domain-containing protein [Candidatus Gottesmanbacteria bacterium]|nr:LytR C-terminal domain-containing protein [Candidatus Gottesmanbacteria bacterium]
MVTRDGSSSKRRTKRLVRYILPLSLMGIFLIVLYVVFRMAFSPVGFRQTVVIVGDPVHVVSFDAKTKRATVVDLPLDAVISAALGYGKYSVGALLSLDEIDHRGGKLITSSISNTLGLPVQGHMIVPKIGDGNMDREMLQEIFSYGSIAAVASQNIRGSIPLSAWVRLVLLARSLSADGLQIVSVEQALIESVAPDGSTARSVDESRIDYILDTAFFDAGIRAEGTSVAIYNTTSVSSVGQRASRQLGRVGMQLVFVGNAEQEVERCVLSGNTDALKTKSAQFILAYYGCDVAKDSEQGKETGADLVVLLGTEFANRYK